MKILFEECIVSKHGDVSQVVFVVKGKVVVGDDERNGFHKEITVLPKSPPSEFTGPGPRISVVVPQNMYPMIKTCPFFEWVSESVMRYDNLINICIMVKNGGDTFERVLRENMKFADCWTILDTGSTDGTQEVVRKVLKSCRYTLVEEPFINFRDSRNRCLDLAGTVCKFNFMIDDTYLLHGDIRSFLHEVRGDSYSSSFDILIQDDNILYPSNRIIPSASGLRYIYKIHEIIQPKHNSTAVFIPKDIAFIKDLTSQHMITRSACRIAYDLEILREMLEEDPENPRHLYYMGLTYNAAGDYEQAARWFKLRAESKLPGLQPEKMEAALEYARILNFRMENVPWEIVEKAYLDAYDCDPSRPDALYFIGIHYCSIDKNPHKAFHHLARAFELISSQPSDFQFSMRPSMARYYLPIFLMEASIQVGQREIALRACRFFIGNIEDSALDHVRQDHVVDKMKEYLKELEK